MILVSQSDREKSAACAAGVGEKVGPHGVGSVIVRAAMRAAAPVSHRARCHSRRAAVNACCWMRVRVWRRRRMLMSVVSEEEAERAGGEAR